MKDINCENSFKKKNRKRIHGHGQQDGDCRGEGGIRGISSNGKKYNKVSGGGKSKNIIK